MLVSRDEYVLVCSIVEENMGNDVLDIAYDHEISGGTVVRGKGSVQSKFLNLLGLSDVNKDICLNILKKEQEEAFYDALNLQLKFDQPHHGLIFSLPVIMALGLRNHNPVTLLERDDTVGVDAIFTIVKMGQGEEVISLAKQAGARGATILHGRGSGVHKKSMLFNFEIEPEKDVVMILSPKTDTEGITDALNHHFNFVEPGHGILFVLDVSKTLGMYQKDAA